MPRPDRPTPEIQAKIVQALRAGNYLETAAAYAGIRKQEVLDWRRRGEREESGPYHEFALAVEQALAAAEVRDVAIVAKAAEENWQAAAWRLERMFPERWGRQGR